MPTVKITRPDGQTFEISGLSLGEIKELIGSTSANGASRMRDMALPTPQNLNRTLIPDYEGFKAALTEKGRRFLAILSDSPHGTTSDHLATQLGFKTGAQLGGMAGGGIGKSAAKFGISVESLYGSKVEFGPNGRIVRYFAGPEIMKALR